MFSYPHISRDGHAAHSLPPDSVPRDPSALIEFPPRPVKVTCRVLLLDELFYIRGAMLVTVPTHSTCPLDRACPATVLLRSMKSRVCTVRGSPEYRAAQAERQAERHSECVRARKTRRASRQPAVLTSLWTAATVKCYWWVRVRAGNTRDNLRCFGVRLLSRLLQAVAAHKHMVQV